jgi:hypothetical protein
MSRHETSAYAVRGQDRSGKITPDANPVGAAGTFEFDRYCDAGEALVGGAFGSGILLRSTSCIPAVVAAKAAIKGAARQRR